MARQQVTKAKMDDEKRTRDNLSSLSESHIGKNGQKSVKDQVYDRLRLNIISFELTPGERISETYLAKRLGVGIASVRSVLPRLVQEGLVVNQQRVGHVVAPITLQDVHGICQLREMLEPEAAAQAAIRADISVLEAIDHKARQYAVQSGRAAEMESLLANREFHVAIAAATGNERLCVWIAQLQDFSIRFHYLLRHELAGEWEHSHEPLIEALKSRDPDRAREEMRRHLSRGRELIMQAILQLPNLQGINIGRVHETNG